MPQPSDDYDRLVTVPTQAAGVSPVLADDWNWYVRDGFESLRYGHLVFSDVGDRNGKVQGSPTGMMAYLVDSDSLTVLGASGWREAVNTASIEALAVTTAKIAALAVTTAKINDNAVTTAKIDDNAVTQAKMADNSVGTAEIINANVTADKLSLPAGGALTLIDSQTFTSSTTYAKPTNAKLIFIEFWTPGNGGSGGSSNSYSGTNAAYVTQGGLGGNGGKIKFGVFNANIFSSTITVTVGAGGAGGAGGLATVVDVPVDGTNGSVGGVCYFGPVFAADQSNNFTYDGGGGLVNNASVGGSPGYSSLSPRAGFPGINNANLINCNNYYLAGCSGGGGGGRGPTASGTYSSTQNGAEGGGSPVTAYASLTAGGGASGGTAPGGNGSNGTVSGNYGLGGAGGASGFSVNGGNGGNGATPGGGGGGGGGTRINYTGGSGGSGGNGLIKIWVYG